MKLIKSQVFTALSLLIAFATACTPALDAEEAVIVYQSDFAAGDLSNISTTASIISFGGQAMLGTLNNESITLSLSDMPKHRFVEVSLDLYVHDSWDGNAQSPDGPDVWEVIADDTSVLHTTFSNTPCEPTYCFKQSFPDPFPTPNDPRTGQNTALSGFCHLSQNNNGTALYTIKRIIRHTKDDLRLVLRDQLVQTNTPDPKCDESWSLGNIRISILP